MMIRNVGETNRIDAAAWRMNGSSLCKKSVNF
jgi:hypothetical protein